MKDRLLTAMQDAVVITVKWLVVVILTCGFSYAVIGDYVNTRLNAQKGAAAFDFINKQIAEQQKAPQK